METQFQNGMEILEKMVDEFGLEDLPDSAVMKNIVPGTTGRGGTPWGPDIAVADVLDALKSQRHDKEAWTMDVAIEELDRLVSRGRGTVRCPLCGRRGAAARRGGSDPGRFKDV